MSRMRTVLRALALASLASQAACYEGSPPLIPFDGGPPPGPAVTWRESEHVAPVFIGSGGFAYAVGSATVGAAAPQGLVKVGPDTKGPWGTIRFLHFSGYWYGDDTILGFSHMHLHGTGATDYGVLAFMPSDGFDPALTSAAAYASRFQKANETAAPGRYSVLLDRGGIAVDITATPRAAHHRYTYSPSAVTGHVIVDLDHHLDGGSVADAEITLDPAAQRLRGRLRSVGGMSGGFGGYDVFFEARTRAPWTEALTWHDGGAPEASNGASGAGVGVALAFDLAGAAPVEMQVGISLVSPEGAAANLAAEMPAWDLEATAKKTTGDWDALLGTVRFEGGTEVQRDIMTASLYHLFLMPTVTSDGDGAYRGVDDQVRQAKGHRYVSDLSLWDTYRTLHPIYSLIAPDRARDAVISLHEMAKAGGFFPKWPIATGESGVMIGSSAEVVVADAFIKGITDFDAEGAYGILRAAAMDPTPPAGGRGGRDWVEPYAMLGYVPSGAARGPVSQTTEYAVDDFALAALAEGLGHGADAAALRARAIGYRQLYDPETGFLWAKDEAGEWSTPHTDPTAFGDEFVEANAWQSMWMVALDAEGLAELAGGKAALVKHLEEMFTRTKEDFDQIDFTDPLNYGAMRPYYWGGNEPDINAPYTFAQLGRPDLTQKWVAWLRASLYTAGPDGLPGNDDGGTMSAWFVFSALGFYPIVGSDRYILGAPLFPHAEVAVPGGTFTVDAPTVSDTNIYVQSVTLDGKQLAKPEIVHADLRAGGSLVFEMGPTPSTWARSF